MNPSFWPAKTVETSIDSGVIRHTDLKKYGIVIFAVLAVLSAIVWVGDGVTLQGERTVYTVKCESGTWTNNLCSGTLVAAERFRFRALTAHSEVLFWIAGSTEPSGKLAPCVIKDGRNWKCRASADAANSVTLEMSMGLPVRDQTGITRPFHEVSKFTWILLEYQVPFAYVIVGNRSN